ncbi:gamma-glutamylcyclotransferase family protein [Yoonia sediminilitoris]|uniref:ChaC-like protein n=1 Tax=Yoonia sediminilitoris TaxID=1286148 RepID=A0A2T6KFX6_9RHOB|nr:gamma-glutamylcyclotransferase family protein [Yoonia sediminilitoris]PUB14204.1 hypothetical protein C8N45_10678 [Yoonia sediminilitoris]RCW95135.1 hypothetical protein DFP92_10678 [Yoonia sediminilitoris]
MNDPAFFGYGSLVNLATHNYAASRPVRLGGWHRIWRTSTHYDAAFLSVERSEDYAIDGILAHVPGADWAALDEREAAYDRHDITGTLDHAGPVAIYQVSPKNLAEEGQKKPILRSYLDVVAQGFLQQFGEQGVEDFFSTTTGWETGVVDDRDAPRYPRHQSLTAVETALVDHHLKRLG